VYYIGEKLNINKDIDLIPKAINLLLNLNGSEMKEASYRKDIQSSFFNLLQAFHLYYSGSKCFENNYVKGREESISEKLKDHETALAQYFKLPCDKEKTFDPQDLWIGKDQLICRQDKNSYEFINCYLPPRFFRLPSNFTGEVFIVGGERKVSNDRQGDYILNADSKKLPDILGIAQNLSSYICIPGEKFSTIIFEFVNHDILLNKNVLKECNRIMKVGGKFIFKTCHNSKKFYYENKQQKDLEIAKKNIINVFENINEYNKISLDEKWNKENSDYSYYWNFETTKIKDSSDNSNEGENFW
jgi:hypothetical protein